MSCYYKVTKNPKTGQFEQAFWMDVVRFYYVAFPDGSMYHEQYCLWEFQEEETKPVIEALPPLQKIA
jgi:hypothetical protein